MAEVSYPGNNGIPRHLLIAEDEPSILSAMDYYFKTLGYTVHCASNAAEALELFNRHRPPVVITDLKMPGMEGDRLLVEIKRVADETQIIIVTGFGTIQSAITTMKAGAFDYITKPFRLEVVGHAVEKAREHLALLLSNRHLQENSIHVLESMVKILEQRDFYTAGHSRRVTEWADAVAAAIALDDHARQIIHLAGLIHDVGKIGIDDSILRKPGQLSPEEYEVIKTHPDRGIQIIEPLEFLRDTVPIIRHHHEWFNGSGYPQGISRDQIPLGARIMAVADTFDAMTSSRAYRQALLRQAAVDELLAYRGKQFDPEIVTTFLDINPQVATEEAPAH